MRRRRLHRVAMWLVLLACSGPDTPPAPASDTGAPMPPPEWAIGTWRVSGYLLPGISALDAAGAAAFTGDSIVLARRTALLPAARCDEASYRELLRPTDTLLAEYRLLPGALPLPGPKVTVLELLCEGQPMTALGATLQVAGTDSLLSPWDGAFFVLTRDRR